jgi:hypothetical protein
MILKCANESSGIPSKLVEYVWNELVRDTKAYALFCFQMNRGKTIHHRPEKYVIVLMVYYSPNRARSGRRYGETGNETAQMYHLLFLEPLPPLVWPEDVFDPSRPNHNPTVKTLTGKQLILSCSRFDTIEKVKLMLQVMEGYGSRFPL